jgi:hypothetical protein
MPKMVTTPSKPVNFSNVLLPWVRASPSGLDLGGLLVSANIMSASQHLFVASFGSHESFKIEVDNRSITKRTKDYASINHGLRLCRSCQTKQTDSSQATAALANCRAAPGMLQPSQEKPRLAGLRHLLQGFGHHLAFDNCCLLHIYGRCDSLARKGGR